MCFLFIHSTNTACTELLSRVNYIDDTFYGHVFSVDVCLGSLFGIACADGFTDKFANIICQEKGLEGRVDKSFLTLDNNFVP